MNIRIEIEEAFKDIFSEEDGVVTSVWDCVWNLMIGNI
jgi:hypothetical protein